MQIDELRGKLTQIQLAKNTESVKSYLSVLKEIMDNEVMASFNLRGEEAACALSRIQGMSTALNLEKIFDSTLALHAKQNSPIITQR